MGTPALRRKSIRLNPRKLACAREFLGTTTDSETLDRALDIVAAEAAIDGALRATGGKARLRKVFR